MCFNVSVYYSPQGPEWRPRELWVRLPGRPTRAGSHVSGPSQKPQEDLQRHGSLALLDPLSAGAPGGPGGETVGVEQMPRPGEGGAPSLPDIRPAWLHSAPAEGLSGTKPGSGTTSLPTGLPHRTLGTRDPASAFRLVGVGGGGPSPREASQGRSSGTTNR